MPKVRTRVVRRPFSCLKEAGLTGFRAIGVARDGNSSRSQHKRRRLGGQSFGPRMLHRRLLALVPLLFGCSAMWAQTPTLVVTGTGGTTHDFTGSYYGDHGGTPFTISAAQPSVPPADNFNITGSFASTSATIHIQGNVVFGRTVFNGCPYSFCTWVYGAGATLNISLQGTAGTDYAIDITRTASMSAATANSVAAYSASADSTSVNTQSGPPSASFSTVSTIRGTGSISTAISLGGSVGFRQISCVSDAEGCLGGTTYPGGGAGTVDYTLTIVAHVNNQPPISLSCPTSGAMVNSPYASLFAASGGTGTFTSYAIATGSLPPGLVLNSVGGVSGTPTTAGTFPFTGTVTDSSGATGTSPSCSITVAPAPLTLSCPASSAIVNTPYASAFAASGGTGTFTSYTIATGALPPVLSLNSTGGVSGTPTTAGPFSFTGRVTDSSGATATSPTCSITVAPAPCTISIAPSSRAFPAQGGFGEVLFGFVSVTASDSTCQWTYKKLDNVDWLNCTACDVGFTAHGTATVQYTVADNSSGPPRVARIRFEDANHVAQDHTVQQAGVGCGRYSNGCSIPAAALAAARLALGIYATTPCNNPNNPACGSNTAFSLGGPGGSLACDNHDYCYGTYSGALSGPIYDNWKRYCDSKLRADALEACNAAERANESAAVVSNCRTLASAYGLGVSTFGDTIVSGYAYSTAQQIAQSCTSDAPAPDGSISPSGGAVTDNLFGSQAQVVVPQGALNSARDVTISVLNQSPPSIGLPLGFRRAATFFVHFTFEPALPSQTLGMSITLPLVTRLAAGTQVSLYRIDEVTQTLVPVLNAGGAPIPGVVDAGEYSASFTGITSFSTLVGLLSQAAIAGDVDDDLRVDCVDVRLVQTVLGKRTADPGYDARADVNHDGIIDIRDLSFVSQRLPAGTRCQ